MLSALMIVMSSITVFAADSKESSLSAEPETAERVSGMVSVSAPYPFEFVVSTTNETQRLSHLCRIQIPNTHSISV